MKHLTLLAGMTKRTLLLFFRYGFDTISMLLVLFIVFVFIFYGAKTLLPPGSESAETLSAILVGYLVWMLGIFAYGVTAFALVEEATAGTLEQIAMSPFGLRRVLVAGFIASLATQLGMIAVLLVLMMAISGHWLHIDIVSLVPLVILTLVGIQGLGLMIGGLAVVFKRIQGFIQIVQFAFVALIAVPLEEVPWLKYMPLAWGNELIGRVMIDELSLLRIPAADLLFLVAHAGTWLALGLLVFGRFEHVARDRALLGHY